ncbi:GNAT family N-acetyltransferase [Agrobacterium larrymoorei]|uniref:GNAT family N-acetyltransferase n=1 Tax=Agrobacterium larrymoorei TaxID=160699 RepID=A0A4D7DXL7_9HYPH|nr:GNAT family N-acetyltransferase [Agrobacterium larrymoorei]QCI99539.1 GNAT family N-acetyltransferase [Agrobacterium larrymoorei]QYA09085.1 GNAT family N-acetyltransferase [Agrobacterium larrymoorei]
MVEIVIRSAPNAPAAQALVEGLIREYDGRYGVENRPGGARSELERYPVDLFAPPLGDFLLLQRNGETIAGGAFMSHDDETVEIKRVWSHPELRRQGLARRIMVALEESAAELGYTRAYLTTGFRQPEAVGLYLSLGYRPLFDLDADPQLYRSLPFEKGIGAARGHSVETKAYLPATSFEEATERVRLIKAEQEAKILSRFNRYSQTAA